MIFLLKSRKQNYSHKLSKEGFSSKKYWSYEHWQKNIIIEMEYPMIFLDIISNLLNWNIYFLNIFFFFFFDVQSSHLFKLI